VPAGAHTAAPFWSDAAKSASWNALVESVAPLGSAPNAITSKHERAKFGTVELAKDTCGPCTSLTTTKKAHAATSMKPIRTKGLQRSRSVHFVLCAISKFIDVYWTTVKPFWKGDGNVKFPLFAFARPILYDSINLSF
jgi:hypothetical protein